MAETEPVVEVEERAKAQGWVPKDEFKGPEDKWLPADEFVKKGDSVLPILKERNEALIQEVKDLKSKFENFSNAHFKAVREAREKGFEDALKELDAKRQRAVREGDEEAFNKVQREIDKVTSEKIKADTEVPDPTKDPAKDPVFIKWNEQNAWYGSDPELTEYADMIGAFMSKRSKVRGAAFFNEVTKEVRSKYPDRFNTDTPPPVHDGGGSPPSSGRKDGKSYSDLPPEAKKACDSFVKEKLGSKDDYVKLYFEA